MARKGLFNTTLNTIDLSAVERVEVVQGAASATIYGAQGANGAIQIFTKKGKRGLTRIDVSSGYSSNEFLNVGKVQKSRLHPYKTDASGNILAKLDLSSLAGEAKIKHPGAYEMNGIAYDSTSNKIYVTGKCWPNIYEIKFSH